MTKVNRTMYAVLGMLSLGPRSGYDLKKEFEERMSHFWAESVGQIYPSLRRMSDEGLVTARVRSQRGRPDRTVYTITKGGRNALRRWLSEPAAEDKVRNELLLKLFFGPELGRDAALAHIEHFERALLARQSLYRSFVPKIEQLAESPEQELYWKMALRSGQLMTDARLDWCAEARRSLRRFYRTNETATRKRRSPAASGRSA